MSVYPLTGLNSLDFIQHHDQSYVLEINPRPSASMQLYEDDLLRKHLMTASPSSDWQSSLPQSGYTGYQIIYAEQDVVIPDQYLWQNGTMDRPPAGQICQTGQPICSIIVRRKQAHSVLQTLNSQQHKIQKGLYAYGKQCQR